MIVTASKFIVCYPSLPEAFMRRPVRTHYWLARPISQFVGPMLQCGHGLGKGQPMRVAIGSTNPVKCNAVRAVLSPLFPGASFVTVDVPSGVAAQPWGDVETRTGAHNRARAARAAARAAGHGCALMEGRVHDDGVIVA